MTNHFHLLVYLPEAEALSEDEIVRRHGILCGNARRNALVARLGALRTSHPDDDAPAQAILKRLNNRMYRINEFMKVVKQWLTQEYNRRYSHVGTLWDSVYKDVLVRDNPTDLAKRAGYIHLNPVRAAISSEFDEYPWSSLTAIKRGDELALNGLRAIYGDDCSKEDILSAHKHLMSELLEQYKLERAREIAKKRMAGLHVDADPLTTETMIAQAAAQIEESMTAYAEANIVEKAKKAKRGRPVSADFALHVKQLLEADPTLSAPALAEAVGCSIPTAYRHLKRCTKA